MGDAGSRDERVSDLYVIQSPTPGDPTVEGQVRLNAAGNDLVTFIGGVVKSLTATSPGSGITAAEHKVLRQLIHFISDGPAEGFASGAYREVTGTVFPTNITWYVSSSKRGKIVERNMTWSGANLTVDQWEIYDTNGITVLATVTDNISYSGVFETSRTRTIA